MAPSLRFPEFDGEWEECALGDVSEFSNTRIKSSELNRDNYVSTENMLQNFQGIVKARSIPENTNVISFSIGNILISNIRPYLKKVWKATFNGGCSSDVFVLQAKNNLDTDYLHYIVANDRFISFVMNGAKGVKMPRGDKNQMRAYSLFLPSINEQRKISRLLSLLDERITIQTGLIEDLKKLKCAISYKLFNSVHGRKLKLADICRIVKGQQINGDSLTDSGKYYVMNGGTAPSGYFNECNSEADTISVSEGGNSCGYVQYNSVPFWSSGHCYTLKELSSDLDKHYLYHYLKNKENDIMQLRIGTGLPNIQKKDLERFEVIVPEVFIQMNMSHILNLLDSKISNECNYLHCLLVEKKYLLNQMFI